MKKRMKGTALKYFMAMLTVVMLFALAGCGGTRLPEGFDEETVKAAATEFLDYLTAGDYDVGMAMMSEAMHTALPRENLVSIMEDLNLQVGAFSAYKSIAVVGQTSQGKEYATAVVVASYEKRSVTYTVVFNVDMEIDGFYLK